ncbi:MAG: PD-(D/E)XK nuclease domain-containing protein [Saprospiraceae bacterium]|nr:PD-(D/E)XK nuclease domain-containing protein [Saprospiraceae bacterium]
MENLNLDLVIKALDKHWGDGEYHNFESFPSTTIKYKDSRNYQSIVEQLVKESLIEKKGGQMIGRRWAFIGNGPTEHFDTRRYKELHLRITLKGHQFINGDVNSQSVNLKEMIAKIIISIQEKNPKFIKQFKNGVTNQLDEDDFRSEFHRIISLNFNVTSEEESRTGRTDLVVYFSKSNRKIIEFKVWGRNDYKETIKQIYGYLTDSDKEGYILMVNPNRNHEIDDKYKEMIKKDEIGFISNSFAELEVNGFKYYKSEHKINVLNKTIYHFILNVF